MSDDRATGGRRHDPTTGDDRAGSAGTAAFAERLAAVERAVTDGAAAPADLTDAADAEERLARVESALDDLDDRVSELEAATQALRGYVGGVRAVNRDVERRADLALARVEELTDGDAPPDAAGALDSRPADPEAVADSDGGEGERGDDPDGASNDPVGIARRLRDAL